MAIMAKLPGEGAILHPAIQKLLEWENEILLNAQYLAILLSEQDLPRGKSSNKRNPESKSDVNH